MNREELCGAIQRIAWGYVLLHVDFNLGTLDLLPAWLGYVLILQALPAVGRAVESAVLLRPLCICLAVWEGASWVLTFFSVSTEVYVLRVLGTVIGLYFHFQLLTNLAEVAARWDCPERRRLLTLRTVRTILVTFFALPLPWADYAGLALVVLLVHVVVAIWICRVLFSLRRALMAREEEEAAEASVQ